MSKKPKDKRVVGENAAKIVTLLKEGWSINIAMKKTVGTSNSTLRKEFSIFYPEITEVIKKNTTEKKSISRSSAADALDRKITFMANKLRGFQGKDPLPIQEGYRCKRGRPKQ